MNRETDPLYPAGFKTPGYEFLSNFYPSPIVVPAADVIPAYLWGLIAATVEHAYQAARCARLSDALTVIALATPGWAKRMVRTLDPRPDWPAVRVEVMRTLLRAKFEQNPDLRRQLLATGDLPIVEWNHWGDQFWGKTTKEGVGENQLGQLLEALRASARAASTKESCD